MNKSYDGTVEKLPHKTPALTDHGPVAELTETSSTILTGTDGGAFPNGYSS